MQELWEEIQAQRKACDVIVQSKNDLINHIKKDLKIKDNDFSKLLKQQMDDVGQLLKAMNEQLDSMSHACKCAPWSSATPALSCCLSVSLRLSHLRHSGPKPVPRSCSCCELLDLSRWRGHSAVHSVHTTALTLTHKPVEMPRLCGLAHTQTPLLWLD